MHRVGFEVSPNGRCVALGLPHYCCSSPRSMLITSHYHLIGGMPNTVMNQLRYLPWKYPEDVSSVQDLQQGIFIEHMIWYVAPDLHWTDHSVDVQVPRSLMLQLQAKVTTSLIPIQSMHNESQLQLQNLSKWSTSLAKPKHIKPSCNWSSRLRFDPA